MHGNSREFRKLRVIEEELNSFREAVAQLSSLIPQPKILATEPQPTDLKSIGYQLYQI
jgi:hypothetical protein